jgi:DNA-binding IclR family transcriptional regulator
MERSKADSFTAFLEAEQSRKSSAQTASGGTALALLFMLARSSNQQMPVAELMTASGMSVSDFAEALKSLSDSGYLTLAGALGNQVASLTQLGRDVARLAQQK